MRRFAVALLLPVCAVLAACNQTAGQAGPVQAGQPGPACAGLIAEFFETLQRDAEAGTLPRDKFSRATADTRQAETACAAGREVQARSILIATKRNYGYPV